MSQSLRFTRETRCDNDRCTESTSAAGSVWLDCEPIVFKEEPPPRWIRFGSRLYCSLACVESVIARLKQRGDT